MLAHQFAARALSHPEGGEVVRDAFLDLYESLGLPVVHGTILVGDRVLSDAYAFYFEDGTALVLQVGIDTVALPLAEWDAVEVVGAAH